MAPLSAIRSKFITRILWEIFLLVLLIISPTLSRPHALVLPYEFPPMLLALVVFYLWPYLLLRHALLSWPMSTQCPCVQQYPPTSRRCLLLTHLEFAWLRLSTDNPGSLLYPVDSCWSCRVKAATVLVRSTMVLHCDIILSLYSAVSVTRSMRSSCVPSIYFMLFAPWYPPARVDDFCFLLYFRCAAWKCAKKFAQVFS